MDKYHKNVLQNFWSLPCVNNIMY